jgi:hypothetical protein
MKVFWSWQSDTPGKVGRYFVRDALSAAITRLKEAPDIAEPIERETRSALHLDQDRKGISGSPDLARVILEKIEQAAVFVGDVTPIGAAPDPEQEAVTKKIMNPNVAIELGYALHALTDRALLMVLNEHYGSRANLPFDLQSKAGPIMFRLSPDADKDTIAAEARQLTGHFVEALRPYIEQQVEQERQQRPFPAAEPKDGPARFRAAGEPIGNRWDLAPFGSNIGNAVNLVGGPATWLRLMPSFDAGKTWTAQELREAARTVILHPFIWSGLYTVRAADGIGFCNLLTPEDQETTSIVFAFESAEVWAIDTWLLGTHPPEIFIGELEKEWATRLLEYGAFLRHLGVNPPYRWIAGITGVNHWHLQYPAPPGQMRFSGWQGPECFADEIVIEGTYDNAQSTIAALLPFFEKMYERCGIRRPDYLNKV